MSEYHDDSTSASDPVPIVMSPARLRRFQKESGWFTRLMYRWTTPAKMIAEHMQFGDTRAAVVVALKPQIVVAAYTDELDCVAMLGFEDWVAETYPLEIGTRLLTVNTYAWSQQGLADDLIPGEDDTGTYGNIHPIIGEFMTEDTTAIEQRKARISEAEWNHTIALANAYPDKHGALVRNGNPYFSYISGTNL